MEERFQTHVVCKLGWATLEGGSHALSSGHRFTHFEQAVQNQVQQAAEMPRNAPLSARLAKKKPLKMLKLSRFKGLRLTRPGLEPGKTEPKSVVLTLHYTGYWGRGLQRIGCFLQISRFAVAC